MLQNIIDYFYNKYKINIAFELLMDNSNNAKLNINLDKLGRTFYINNFFPITEEKVINIVESFYYMWLTEIKGDKK